jgi:putative restriction endonuclease
MQVSRGALDQAAVTGFAPYKNKKGETAIGIRPDFLRTYIVFRTQLHDSGKLPKEASVLANLSTNPNSVSDASIESRVKRTGSTQCLLHGARSEKSTSASAY